MGIFRDRYSKSFARPDRRYRLAKECLEEGRRLPFGADRATRELHQFLHERQAAHGPTERAKVWAVHADLADAIELRRRKLRPLRNIVQAYLITKADEAAIGERIGLSALTIWWYRAAFYDVQHILRSPIRTTHELIGLYHDDGESNLDYSRLCLWIAYKLGIRGLDALFGVSDVANEKSGVELTDWVAHQAQAVLKLKQLMSAHQLNVNDPKHLELLVKFCSQGHASRKDEDTTLNTYEKHVAAFLQDLPWAVGTDAELMYDGTSLGEYDKGAAELRDDEVLRVAAGGSLDKEIDLPEKLPPPTKKSPQLDIGKSISDPTRQPPGFRSESANPSAEKPNRGKDK